MPVGAVALKEQALATPDVEHGGLRLQKAKIAGKDAIARKLVEPLEIGPLAHLILPLPHIPRRRRVAHPMRALPVGDLPGNRVAERHTTTEQKTVVPA